MSASDAFEYLAVLFSVIVGLAVTELLQGLRKVLLERERVQVYWPALVRALTLLLALAQTWWAMFALREEGIWTFGMYAAVLLHVGLLYFVCAMALPDLSTPGKVEMRAAYFAHSRPFYVLMAAVLAASLLKDVALGGQLPNATNLAFHAGFAALALLAAVSRRDRVHQGVTIALAASFATYVVTLFGHLG